MDRNRVCQINESDQTQTIPMIEKPEQINLKPGELQVDAGCVSGKNIVEAEDKGTRLVRSLAGKPPRFRENTFKRLRVLRERHPDKTVSQSKNLCTARYFR